MDRMARFHCLQHVPFEGPGNIKSRCVLLGHPFSTTRLYAHDPLPATDQFENLIVMDGPMSVHDEARYLWLGW